MPQRKVFISYRRQDSRYQARLIYDALCEVLPNDHVFMDVDSITPGEDFRSLLRQSLESCDILLALIGSSWLDAVDPPSGRRRLDDPNDLVRVEIATALTRGIPVVPVLLDGAAMPKPKTLPKDLRLLAQRQGSVIEYRSFDSDMKALMSALQLNLPSETRNLVESGVAGQNSTGQVTSAAQGPPRTRRFRPLALLSLSLAAGVAVLVLALGWIPVWHSPAGFVPAGLDDPTPEDAIIRRPMPDPPITQGTLAFGGQAAESDEGKQTVLILPDASSKPPAVDATSADRALIVAPNVERAIQFVDTYNGGQCFFAVVAQATSDSFVIKGLGSSAPPFSKFYEEFQQALSFEPDVNVHLISQSQCVVAEFLAALRSITGDEPAISLSGDRLREGQPLTITVSKGKYGHMNVLLIDGDGMAHNLKPTAASPDDPQVVFTTTPPTSGADQPQVVLVLASPSGFEVPDGPPVPASQLLPRLKADIEAAKTAFGMDYRYVEITP
jgi:hypothetical protein